MIRNAACGVALAGFAALALSGCNNQGVSKLDAQTLSASFCNEWLPSIGPLVDGLNAQMQANHATVTRACKAIADGKSINAISVAFAAVTLYEGVMATYHPGVKALSDHDLNTARRLIDVYRLQLYLGVEP